MLTEINGAGLLELLLNRSGAVLVEVWALWCGSCRMLEPLIEAFGEEYPGRVKVCKINVDELFNSSVNLEITALPTVVLIKDGRIVKKWVGAVKKEGIATAINEVL